MNEDRELLGLAALAAGMVVVNRDAPVSLYVRGDGCKGGVYWNPLSDDGDALRLAVMLKITPHIDDNCTDAESRMGFSTEAHLDDPYVATRRAIVRAAAEIGKQMKEQDK